MFNANVGDQVSAVVRMQIVLCASCGVPFSMPAEMNDRRREDGAAFHCPSGHSNTYKATTPALTKRATDAEAEAARLRRELSTARDALKSEQAARTKTKEMVKRVQDETANGLTSTKSMVLAHLATCTESQGIGDVAKSIGRPLTAVSTCIYAEVKAGTIAKTAPGLFALPPAEPIQ